MSRNANASRIIRDRLRVGFDIAAVIVAVIEFQSPMKSKKER